jgi:hypothetical protein
MATKTAKGKHTVHDMTITAKGKFSPDPLQNVKGGDQVRLLIPAKKLVTIKVSITLEKEKGGGGGPVIITS